MSTNQTRNYTNTETNRGNITGKKKVTVKLSESEILLSTLKRVGIEFVTVKLSESEIGELKK